MFVCLCHFEELLGYILNIVILIHWYLMTEGKGTEWDFTRS